MDKKLGKCFEHYIPLTVKQLYCDTAKKDRIFLGNSNMKKMFDFKMIPITNNV